MHNFIITADGGSLGNGLKNSFGYGSFIIERGELKVKPLHLRRTFPEGTTSNEAEYLIVIDALTTIKDAMAMAGNDVKDYSVLIRTDSALVIGQCSQGWKIKALNLRPLWTELMGVINLFNTIEFEKLSGVKMKSILGH